MEKTRPIHERVKDHVDDAGLTYSQIAEETRLRLGAAEAWSEQKVYRLLTGKTELSAADIELLASILGKTVIALYRGKAA